MCFATPGKVIKIKGKIATIQMPHNRAVLNGTLRDKPNHTHQADISLVKGVRIGDFLLVHDKMAINKIPSHEAKNILKLNKHKGAHHHG